MYDRWQEASDFQPGEPVLYVLGRLPGIQGEVVSVHPKLNKVDVQWPTGLRRMDPWELTSAVAYTMAMKASENLRPVVAAVKESSLPDPDLLTFLKASYPQVSPTQLDFVVDTLRHSADWKAVKDSLSLAASKYNMKVSWAPGRTTRLASFKVVGKHEDAKFEAFLRLSEEEDGFYRAEVLSVNVEPPVEVDVASLSGLSGSTDEIFSSFASSLKTQLASAAPVMAAHPRSPVRLDVKDYKKQHGKPPRGRGDWTFEDEKGETHTIENEPYDQAEKQIKEYAEGRKRRNLRVVPPGLAPGVKK